MLSSLSLWGSRAAHLQSDENSTTFNYLGETGSELKMTDLPKKSNRPKSSISAPRLALWAEETGSCSQNHFGEPGAPDRPSYQGNPGLKYPKPIIKAVQRKGQHPLPQSSAYQP
jgi:hypothetical protein